MPRNKSNNKDSEEKKQKVAEGAMVTAKKKQLIEMVQSYPILYDLSHIDYKNTAMKNVVWSEIAVILKEEGKRLYLQYVFA